MSLRPCTDIKGGKINFRVDKRANLHFIIGKASFDERSWPRTTALRWMRSCGPSRRHRRGRYLKKVTVTTTTGPGIPVDPAVTRNFTGGLAERTRRPTKPSGQQQLHGQDDCAVIQARHRDRVRR